MMPLTAARFGSGRTPTGATPTRHANVIALRELEPVERKKGSRSVCCALQKQRCRRELSRECSHAMRKRRAARARLGSSHKRMDRATISPREMRFGDAVMPTIDRDGVKIYYEVHGSGPTLLLTHGYSSTSAMWQGQVQALSRDHKLVLWDMRGHGQSDYPDDPLSYSEALTVADMAALLDEVGTERAIVGGLSLGGYMSLAFYRAHPQRVPALLIIDSRPGLQEDDAREAWNKRAHETGDRFEREGLSVLKSLSRERSSVVHRDASGLARAARGMLTQRDAGVIETLPHINVPSLVVVGADHTPFLAASDYMAAKIPGAQKVVIPAAGHAPYIAQPPAFIDSVLPFLHRLPRQT